MSPPPPTNNPILPSLFHFWKYSTTSNVMKEKVNRKGGWEEIHEGHVWTLTCFFYHVYVSDLAAREEKIRLNTWGAMKNGPRMELLLSHKLQVCLSAGELCCHRMLCPVICRSWWQEQTTQTEWQQDFLDRKTPRQTGCAAWSHQMV